MKRWIVSGFVLCFVFHGVRASEPLSGPAWERSVTLHALMMGPVSSELPPTLSQETQNRHFSKVGILFSAALPGAGQFYTRSWVKGLAFLAAEVALWMGSSHWNDEGDRIKNKFHAFVDDEMDWAGTPWEGSPWKHRWDYDKWVSMYNSGSDPSTHNLPHDEEGNIVKTQQYYEMIGKYDQFKQGWIDWVPGSPDLTAVRDQYETLRDDSNRAYIKASYCSMAILGNHLISALDAALTIHKVNAKAQMGVAMTPVVGEPVLLSGVVLNW